MKVSAKSQRFPKHCLLILYSHVRLCAAAALAGAAVAWKSLQKCPRRPDRLEWVCEPASAAGRRKVGQPAGPSCKIRHLTSPLLPSVPLPRSWVYPACTVCTTELQPTFYPLESTPMSPADVWPRLWISFCVWTALSHSEPKVFAYFNKILASRNCSFDNLKMWKDDCSR